MADHYQPGLLPRTYFRAPRVPFDFRALALTILGFLVYWAGSKLLNTLPYDGPGDQDVAGAFLAWALQIFRGIPYIGDQIEILLRGALRVEVSNSQLEHYGFWKLLLGGAWFFGVWSFFGQGVHRITTLRIARDEGLSIAEALKFSAKNWTTMLLCPVIIFGVIGLFWCCNALAGVLISIPLLGGILSIVLVPLIFISTLLILLVGVGGVLGMPLIGAAAAWECNGSLDAISRAFSYLFARPLQYFWNFFLIFLFTGIVLLVGTWFTFTLAKSTDAGVWNDVQEVMLDPAPYRPEEGSDFAAYDRETLDLYKAIDADAAQGRAPFIAPPAMNISTVTKVPWTFKLNALVFWLVLNFIWLAVSGYALYWLIGGASSVYADLRADVDGTEEDEVYIEEEQSDLDALSEDGPAVEGAAAEAAAAEPTADAEETKPDAGDDSDTSV
jgi:hypothetical protein